MPRQLVDRWLHPGSIRVRMVLALIATLLVAPVPIFLADPPAGAGAAEPPAGGLTRLSTGRHNAIDANLAAVGRVVHSVWADPGLSGGSDRVIGYRRSPDGGTTWSPVRPLSMHPGTGHAESPEIAADGDVVAVTWSETTSKDVPDAGNRQVWAAVSVDGGVTFGDPFRVDEDRADSWHPQVAVKGDDVWIAWGDLSHDVYVATSHDRGASFALHQLADGTGYELIPGALSADGEGTVAVTWSHIPSRKRRDVGARASQDGGDTWSDPVAVTTAEDGTFHMSPVVVASERTVHVTWSDGKRRLMRSSFDGGRSFGSVVDHGEGTGRASVTARPGLIAIGWGDSGNAGVRVITSHDRGASWNGSLVAGQNAYLPDLQVQQEPPDTGPRARFTWSMPERFGVDRDGDGLVDYSQTPSYLHPNAWLVTFDGCASSPGGDDPDGALSYTWTVDGDPFGSDACTFQHVLTDFEPHTVRLVVRAENGRSAETVQQVTAKDLFIVSIGDSVASGEGNPDIPGGGPWPWSESSVWQDRQCNRSAKAGPALAARRIEQADRHSSVTFLHLACSGATVRGPDNSTGGLLTPYTGINPREGSLLAPQMDQIERLAADRAIDAVFISIGANDLHFSGVVSGCLTTFACYTLGDVRKDFDQRLVTLPDHYAQLADRLEQLGIEDVYITEYFDPTVDHHGAWNLSCAANLGQAGLSDSEARWAASYVMGKLNGAVRAAADQYGWTYVGGIAEQFHGHGYCSEDPWVVQLGESFQDQADKNGSFHPDNTGHEVYGRRIADTFHTVRQPAVERPEPAADWNGDLFMSWMNGDEVVVTTLRADGGAAWPVRTVAVSEGGTPNAFGFTSMAVSEEGAWVAWMQDTADPEQPRSEWHTFAAPAARPPADVAAVSAELTQAVDGAEFLVAGTTTAVHAEVVSTLPTARFMTVRTTVRDAQGGLINSTTAPVAVKPGHNDLYLRSGGEAWVPESGSWWAQVEIDPHGQVDEADESNNSMLTAELPVRASRRLRTLYVPMGGASCATSTGLAESSSPWLHAVLPVADGALTQHSDCSYAAPGRNTDGAALNSTLESLSSVALLNGYDTAVGVVPSGWLQSNTGGAVGLGLYGSAEVDGPAAAGVLVEQGQGPSVIAHEIGHNFGLEHLEDTPTSGYWVAGGTAQSGVDFMDPFVGGSRWVGAATWSALMDRFEHTAEAEPVDVRLAAATSESSLLVRGTVAPDGAVHSGPWYQVGEPADATLRADGDLVLEYRDSSGAVLATVGLPVHELAPVGGAADGGAVAGYGSFGARVPWLDGAVRLVLRRGAAVVADRPVTGAPDVRLTAPDSTSWAAPGQTLEVRWTAVDPDGSGDDLRAALSYSTDGGDSYKPVDLDLPGTEYSWQVGDHLAGKPLQLRLDVTDGVRTTSVVSEPFTVGGTPPGSPPRLAVARGVRTGEPEGASGLHTMLPDGSDLQRVPQPYGSVTDPAWSSDAERIAFSANSPLGWRSRTAVFAVAPDGSGLTTLTPPPSSGDWTYTCPAWHPDGSKVLVRGGNHDNGQRELYWAAADGSGLTRVAEGVMNDVVPSSCPRLSPDGSKVTFRDVGGIQLHDLGTGVRTLLVPSLAPDRGTEDDPFWSADGGSVIFERQTGFAANAPIELVRVPADGSGTPTVVADLRMKHPLDPARSLAFDRPRSSPDGNRILFSSGSNGWETDVVCSMHLDGSGLSCLRDEPDPGPWYASGGFGHPDLAAQQGSTPTLPPPWNDPAPVVEPPRGRDADAGGPYTAIEDQPVHLDAGASAVLAGGEIPLVEWDLDDDGDFDDATGVRAIGIIRDSGERRVRVRITKSSGQRFYAETTATVSAAPPSILTPASATAVAGRPTALQGVTVEDPGQGEHTVTVAWGDGTTETVTARSDGTVDAAHTWSDAGDHTVTVEVCDAGTTTCATATVVVKVLPARSGSAPVVEDSTVRTPTGAPILVELPVVEPDGDSVELFVDAEPSHGTARILGDSLEYTPDPGYSGIDTVGWTATDVDGSSEPATLTVRVGNTAPVATDDEVRVDGTDPIEIDVDTLLANDDDTDGDTLRLVGAYAGDDTVGSVERSAGVVTFTPDGPLGEPTTFEYAVSDGEGGVDLGTVTLIPTDSPPPTSTTSTTTSTVPPASTSTTTTTTTTVPPTTTSTTSTTTTTVPPATSTTTSTTVPPTTSSTTTTSTTTTSTTVPSPTTTVPPATTSTTTTSTTVPSPTTTVPPPGPSSPSSLPQVVAEVDDPGPAPQVRSGGVSRGRPSPLAFTGGTVLPLVALAAVLLAAGLGALGTRRRTRGQPLDMD